jgi:hypothetical protein
MSGHVPRISLDHDLACGERSAVDIHDSKQRGRITIFRKPSSPDPFVNAQLTRVGSDDKGQERFFISCLSGVAGVNGFVIAENGQYTSYTWEDLIYVYGVIPQDKDCLWLAGGGDSNKIFMRLDLSTGERQTFPVEGGRFITAGMALDPDSGKLFCGAQTALVCFDTRTQKTVRIYDQDEKPPDNFHYDHWRLADGSYGFILETPGLSFLRWDPNTEDIRWQRLTGDIHHPAIGLVRWLKYVEHGRLYLPHFGWLDGITGEITPHQRPPDQEACWLGRRGDTVYGVQSDNLNACARIMAWNLANAKTTALFTVPDTSAGGCALTRGGKLLSVDLYGNLRRHDLATGALELTRTLESQHEHGCNVILPAGNDRVVGTPFISMNFWGFDTRQGKGFYGGRVAGSYGQCDDAVKVGDKIYFAIYGGGQLTEYDPGKQTGFPRNPRVVAQNNQGQHGAGIATDGRAVWVAFRPKYGTLDGAMIRYDTTTGEASYRNGAMPGQTIVNPMVDTAGKCLVAGTTFLSDCSTATPIHDRVFAVTLDPLTMEVTGQVQCPDAVDTLINHGPLDTNRWLMRGGDRLFVFDVTAWSLAPFEQRPAVPHRTIRIAYAGTPGRFLIQIGDTLHAWDAQADRTAPMAEFASGFVGRWWVHGADMTFDCGRYAALWRGGAGGASPPSFPRGENDDRHARD